MVWLKLSIFNRAEQIALEHKKHCEWKYYTTDFINRKIEEAIQYFLTYELVSHSSNIPLIQSQYDYSEGRVEIIRTRPLVSISWNWTNLCNYTCLHCYSRTESYDRELTLEESKKIVTQMSTLGLFTVHFGGGECLVRKDFIELLNFVSTTNIYTELTSNGSFLNKALCNQLKSNGLKQINLSLDGLTKIAHDRIRNKKGSFDRVISGIIAAKSENLRVNLICMISKTSIPHIDEIVSLAISHRADKMSFKLIKNVGNAINNSDFLYPNADELKMAYKILISLSIQYEDVIEIDYGLGSDPMATWAYKEFTGVDFEKYVGGRGCSCGDTSICIKPNGDVTTCAYSTYSIGNVLVNPLIDIWNSLSENETNSCENSNESRYCFNSPELYELSLRQSLTNV